MADKKFNLNIFAKTETLPGQETEAGPDISDLDDGVIRASGVGLKNGELTALNEIAGKLGIARNALMRFAIRWFIYNYRAGQIDLTRFIEQPPPPKKTLRMLK
jgi:hypothetical protein